MLLVAKRMARLDFLETHSGTDVAGLDAVEGVLLVGVHLHDARDTLLLAGVGVVDIRATLQRAAVDAEEAQTSHIGVGGNLESEGREGGLDVHLAALLFLRLGVDATDFGHVERAGKELGHSIEQRLYALVFECRTTHHRHNLARQRGLADLGDDLLGGDAVRVVEELHHQLLVLFGHTLDEFLPVLGGDVLQVVGHGYLVELGTV